MKTIFKNGLGVRGVLGAALMIMVLATTGCGKEDIQLDQLLGTWVTDEENPLTIKQVTFAEDECYFYVEPHEVYGEIIDGCALYYRIIGNNTLCMAIKDVYGGIEHKIEIAKLNSTTLILKADFSSINQKGPDSLEFRKKE